MTTLRDQLADAFQKVNEAHGSPDEAVQALKGFSPDTCATLFAWLEDNVWDKKERAALWKEVGLPDVDFWDLEKQVSSALVAVANDPESLSTSEIPVLFDTARLEKLEADLKAADSDQRPRVFFEFATERETLICDQYADQFLDALLVLIGTRGEVAFGLDQLFQNFGRKEEFFSGHSAPVNIKAQAAPYKTDAPDAVFARRLLHEILRGITDMPTTYAGSAAQRYFKGTGSQNELKGKAGVGLLSTKNAWAKEQKWKNATTEQVITPLFADHYADYDGSVLGTLLTTADPKFVGYPAGDLWDAAYEKESNASPFAMTHSTRNTTFIKKMLGMLEQMGIGEEIEYAPPALEPKLHPGEAKDVLLAEFESTWKAGIAAAQGKWDLSHDWVKQQTDPTTADVMIGKHVKVPAPDAPGTFLSVNHVYAYRGALSAILVKSDDQIVRTVVFEPGTSAPTTTTELKKWWADHGLSDSAKSTQ